MACTLLLGLLMVCIVESFSSHRLLRLLLTLLSDGVGTRSSDMLFQERIYIRICPLIQIDLGLNMQH